MSGEGDDTDRGVGRRRVDQGDRAAIGVSDEDRPVDLADLEQPGQSHGLVVQPASGPGTDGHRSRSTVPRPVVGEHGATGTLGDARRDRAPLGDRAETVVEEHELRCPLAPGRRGEPRLADRHGGDDRLDHPPRSPIGPDSIIGVIYHGLIVRHQLSVELQDPAILAPSLGARRDRSATIDTSRGLLMTVLGELVLPNGGAVWTQTLIETMELLDVRPKAARQSIARMHDRGWLDRTKVGRRTRWRLTVDAEALLASGARQIYDFGREPKGVGRPVARAAGPGARAQPQPSLSDERRPQLGGVRLTRSRDVALPVDLP